MADAIASRGALTALLPAAAFVVCLAQDSPSDYPQWRGASRDGSASAFVWPSAWPDALTKRWRVEVGEGSCSKTMARSSSPGRTRRDFSR
jgi:hypothetical protein